MATQTTKSKNPVLEILAQREAAIFIALILISLFIALMAPQFRTTKNIYLVSRQISFVAIVALGELFVILTSGIDLSVGSTVGLTGMITGLALAAGIPPIIALPIGVLAGVLIGIFNGAVIAYVGITPFIVTLGALSMGRGLSLVLTKGNPIIEMPSSFFFLAQSDIFGIPMPVIIAIIIAAIVHVILTYTAFGRRIYAIGGNEQATALSGVDVKKIKLMIYAICGLMAGIVGVLLVARFNSAQPATGKGWELDAIASTVIGGTSLSGGVGTVLGVLIGATIMGVIRNGLVLMQVSAYWQDFIIGGIIVLAAVVDRIKNK
ncbi:transporter [Candidatus Moduliflexus flocculans]|uniref:Transporter n=1 Tax=Candidatus Moduliflexus flocculans TaxID=1499966 RepID=A0A081BPR9_9BACT|nr:transporter [Candidatus Moduliflexus flocculans]